MRISPFLDKAKTKIMRRLAPKVRPGEQELGFPPFSQRIKDRHRRWHSNPELMTRYDYILGKAASQDYMRDLGYAVPEVYARFPRITALSPLYDLPANVVLKPDGGHSAQHVFILRDGVNIFDGSLLTRDSIVEKVGPDCPFPFFAEELLLNFDGTGRIANDVKFHCFGDKIAFVLYIERNHPKDISQNRYYYLTEDWQLLGIRTNSRLYPEKRVPPKPDCFAELRDIARDVGRRMNMFMRIDLYATTRGPVFGEFTPCPTGGMNYTAKAEEWLGGMWKGLEGCDDVHGGSQQKPSRRSAL